MLETRCLSFILIKLTIIEFLPRRGVGNNSKQKIVKISELIDLHCSSCISSHWEYVSKCLRIAVLVCRKIDAILASTFPHDAKSMWRAKEYDPKGRVWPIYNFQTQLRAKLVFFSSIEIISIWDLAIGWSHWAITRGVWILEPTAGLELVISSLKRAPW